MFSDGVAQNLRSLCLQSENLTPAADSIVFASSIIPVTFCFTLVPLIDGELPDLASDLH